MEETVKELKQEVKNNLLTTTEKEEKIFVDNQGTPFDTVMRKVIPSYIMGAFAS
jgi:hypothetical protein